MAVAVGDYVYQSGTVLFATVYHDKAIDEAIFYCEYNGLPQDKVKIVKTYKKESPEIVDMILVKVK